MPDEQNLLVCAEGRAEAVLTKLIQDGAQAPLTAVHSVSEARRRAAANAYATVIVNAPLRDETGLEWAIELSQTTTCAVMVLIKAELIPMAEVHATDAGVLLVAKPVVPQLFAQALSLAAATHRRLMHMDRENEKLHRKLAELRVVDRAKCLLIEHMGVTEEAAHRLIEKRAMDERTPRVDIANEILRKYEL